MPPRLQPRRKAPTLLVALASLQAFAAAPVVIVNPQSKVEILTPEEATNLFMGRQKRMPDGTVAILVEQANPPQVRALFYQRLVGKDIRDINSYWAKLFFSGQAQPPRQGANAQEVLDTVALNPGAIGMVDGAEVDRRVRIVLTLVR